MVTVAELDPLAVVVRFAVTLLVGVVLVVSATSVVALLEADGAVFVMGVHTVPAVLWLAAALHRARLDLCRRNNQRQQLHLSHSRLDLTNLTNNSKY